MVAFQSQQQVNDHKHYELYAMRHNLILLAIIALTSFIFSCKNEENIISAPSIKLGETTLNVSKTGGSSIVAVVANCNWEAESDQSWVKVAPETGTAATNTLHLMVEENNTGAVRTANVLVSGHPGVSVSLMINQSDANTVQGEISSVEEFVDFLNNAASATASDVFTITKDIDMGGAVLTPATSFSGVLDGGNHKIHNYQIKSGQAMSGLFLTLSGSIKDLILGSSDGKSWDGRSIVTFDDKIETTSHIGGVTAVLAGSLENVKNFAKVSTPTGTTSLTGIGGIAGMTESASSLLNCENGGIIDVTGTTAAETYIAGIIAYVNNAEALISNCVNTAPLDVSIHIFKVSIFGGIVGRANLGATIRDCSNEANISYTQQDTETNGNYIMIAGVAGALYTGSQAIRCKNNGLVSSNNLQVSRIGGIVGTLNNKGTIDNCVNNGDVFLKQAAANNHWQAAGGICGFQEKGKENVIRNNTNNGAVTVEVQNLTTHKNKVNAGGILGFGIRELTLEGNTNKGNVSIVNKEAGAVHAGGIVGWFYGAGSHTADNVNIGGVSSATSDNVSAFAGGIVGLSSAAGNVCSGDKNEGDITCANTSGVGAIAGKNDGLLKNCIVGGKVNGAKASTSNVQGSASTGSVSEPVVL